MRTVTIDDLTLANRPMQFAMLERITSLLTASDAVTHLLVRGSIASGTADRLSDIDFVIGATPDKFILFAQALDTLMEVAVSAILPGWRDTIVRRMGGIGYVYLAVSEGQLIQVDIYLAPAQEIGGIADHTGARLLYGDVAQAVPVNCGLRERIADFVDIHHERSPSCQDTIIEILILVMMIGKRIRRSEHFIVYALTYQLMSAVKDLIRNGLASASPSWGWYDLREDVGWTELGSWCLAELAAMIAEPPIRTKDDLVTRYRRIEVIARSVVPESMADLAPAVTAYTHYLELA